jgi:hypothetical protein
MQELKITAIACLVLLGAAVSGAAALTYETPEAKPLSPAVPCKEAIVNPVSGDAEWVRPRGAPVDPPPPNRQEANFAGRPDGWASGVRMLIKHRVLVPADEP